MSALALKTSLFGTLGILSLTALPALADNVQFKDSTFNPVKWFETSVQLGESFVVSDMNTFDGYVSQSFLDAPSQPNPTVDNGELRFDLEIPDLTEKEVIAIRRALRRLDRAEIALGGRGSRSDLLDGYTQHAGRERPAGSGLAEPQ